MCADCCDLNFKKLGIISKVNIEVEERNETQEASLYFGHPIDNGFHTY